MKAQLQLAVTIWNPLYYTKENYPHRVVEVSLYYLVWVLSLSESLINRSLYLNANMVDIHVPDIKNATILVLSDGGAHFPNMANMEGIDKPYITLLWSICPLHTMFLKTSNNPASIRKTIILNTPTGAIIGISDVAIDENSIPMPAIYLAPNLSASSPPGILSQGKP